MLCNPLYYSNKNIDYNIDIQIELRLEVLKLVIKIIELIGKYQNQNVINTNNDLISK